MEKYYEKNHILAGKEIKQGYRKEELKNFNKDQLQYLYQIGLISTKWHKTEVFRRELKTISKA